MTSPENLPYDQTSSPQQNHHVPSIIRPLEMSKDIDKIAAALAKAQGEIKHPKRDKVAKVKTKTGPDYSYAYSDLASLLDCTREPFAKNGLAMIQMPCMDPDGVGVVTLLTHESGQWFKGYMVMPFADSKPLTIGSAITYCRRYSAGPMAGITAEDDDDGNSAQGNDAQTGARGPAPAGATPPRSAPPGPAPSGQRQATPPPPTAGSKLDNTLRAFSDLGVTRDGVENILDGKQATAFDDEDYRRLRLVYDDAIEGRLSRDDLLKMAVKKPTAAKPAGRTQVKDAATKSKLDNAFAGKQPPASGTGA